MNNTTQAGDGGTVGVGHEDGAGNVDKIRDILFGGQMRDYEQRFRRLEENLLRESNEIREMTRQRLDALEEYIKREFEAQSQRLRAERDERSALNENLSRRLNESNDAASETSRSIREEILSRSTSLLQEMQHRHRESNESVERHVSQLRSDKADRSAIAALLSEMAMRLTGDFKLPEAPPEQQ